MGNINKLAIAGNDAYQGKKKARKQEEEMCAKGDVRKNVVHDR